MKRAILSAFILVAAASIFASAGRDGGGSRSSNDTVYRRRRVNVPKTAMPRPEHVVHGESHAAFPKNDESGAAISKSAASMPPAHHSSVMRNADFARNMPQLERAESRPNQYYWHNEGGMRYSHYYDGRVHWYGFYHGPTFYWTRYYGNRWWWFDAHFARWVFWGNGYWWWPGPGGVPYVYMDNNYYPYEGAGVTVEQAVTQAPPSAIPAPAQDKGTTTNSADGRRMVQVFGADAQAFLYDKTVTPPTYLKYLGQGVTKVRFSGGNGGAPIQILVEFKDDTFAMFDADGNSQSAAVKSDESAAGAPPPTPDSIPPPPTSAPGQ